MSAKNVVGIYVGWPVAFLTDVRFGLDPLQVMGPLALFARVHAAKLHARPPPQFESHSNRQKNCDRDYLDTAWWSRDH